jgi:hypothetical protein
MGGLEPPIQWRPAARLLTLSLSKGEGVKSVCAPSCFDNLSMRKLNQNAGHPGAVGSTVGNRVRRPWMARVPKSPRQ